MRKYEHSKNRIFLLEITINILLFSVLLIVGLLFFIRTHTLTEKTGVLHQAVNICSNIASVYEQEEGSLAAISDLYDGSINSGDILFIYFDEKYHACDKDISTYKVVVTPQNQDNSGVNKADITFLDSSNESLYNITACNYKSLTPAGRTVDAQ